MCAGVDLLLKYKLLPEGPAKAKEFASKHEKGHPEIPPTFWTEFHAMAASAPETRVSPMKLRSTKVEQVPKEQPVGAASTTQPVGAASTTATEADAEEAGAAETPAPWPDP